MYDMRRIEYVTDGGEDGMGGVLACTGSRPNGLYGYGRRRYGTLLRLIAATMVRLRDGEGFDTVETGGAQGADMLCFAAADRLNRSRWSDDRVSNVVISPFEGQERRWSEDGMFGRGDYRRMVSRADAVETVSATPGRRAYILRNHVMIDRATLVLAVCMDDPREAETGTGSTVRYALRRGRTVVWLDPSRGGAERIGG